MAKTIQAWTEFGPRLEATDPVTSEDVIEQLVDATNQTRGSVLGVLAELDDVIERGLKSGRIVQLPNGTHFRPIGKKDGSVDVSVRLNPRVKRQANAGFRGKWRNAANIGKNEDEIVALWNAAHPDDLIE